MIQSNKRQSQLQALSHGNQAPHALTCSTSRMKTPYMSSPRCPAATTLRPSLSAAMMVLAFAPTSQTYKNLSELLMCWGLWVL